MSDRATIPPASGTAFRLRRGGRLTVIDPEGEQVADLVAYAADDSEEWLSSGRTFDYEGTFLLTTGNVLWSNRSRPLLEIVEDTVGRHDFLLTPCSPDTFRLLYDDAPADHPSCFANLVEHLAPFAIPPDRIPTTFNVFMNVQIAPDGAVSVEPPRSRAGDRIVFEAREDLVVGLTACSAEKSNAGTLKRIEYVVEEPPLG